MAKFNPVQYSKNVLRSAGYVGVETIKGINPNLTSLITETASVSKSVYSVTKDFIRNPKMAIREYVGEEAAQAASEVKHNILDDIRTGKFYNAERSNAETNKIIGEELGFNFDDLDLDVDEDFGEDKPSIGRDRAIGNLSITQQKLTQASTDKITSNASANTTRSLTQQAKMFGVVNNSLSAINTSILNLHKSLAQPLNDHIQNSTIYYKTATELMAKQTAYLENINKLLTDYTNRGLTEDKKKTGKNAAFKDVLGYGFDPNALMTHAKKNFVERTVLGQLKDLVDPETIKMLRMSGALSSPISAITTLVLTGYLQNGPIGAALNRTENIINSGINTGFQRIHSYRKANKFKQFNRKTGKYDVKNKNPILGFLADVFDIMPDKGFRANMSGNKIPDKRPTQWTGLNDRALREVIPTQLAEIISILTGEEPKIYNYNTGKFQRVSNISRDFRRGRKTNAVNTANRFREDMTDQFLSDANQNGVIYGRNSRRTKNLRDDFDTLVHLFAMSGKNVGTMTSTEFVAQAQKWVRAGLLPQKSMTLFKRYVFADKNLANFRATLLNAQSADMDYVNNNKYDNTFNTAVSAGLTTNERYGKNNNKSGSKKSKAPNVLGTDNNGNDIFFYLQKYYTQLDYIVHRIETNSLVSGDSIGNNDRSSRDSFNNFAKRSLHTIDNRTKEEKQQARLERRIIEHREARQKNKSKEKKYDRDTWNSSKKKYEKAGTGSVEYYDYKDEDNLVSNGINAFNDTLERIIFGVNPTRDDRNYGLLGPLKKIGDTVVNIANEIKEYFRGMARNIWNKIKETDFWQRFTGKWASTGRNARDYVGSVAKATKEHYQDKLNTAIHNYYNDKIEREYDDAFGDTFEAAHGGQVTKSGMVSVSEGELIIPSEHNPFYHGTTNKYSQKFNERKNYNKWKKSTGGRSGLKFWGFYDEGGTAKDKAEGLKDAANRYTNKVKEETKGFETTAFADLLEKILGRLTEDIAEPAKKFFGDAYHNMGNVGKDALKVLKSQFPETMATGTMGALVGGALTGSGLGLLGGFVVGAGVNILQHSEAVSNLLFGGFDKENNEYRGGVLPKKFVNFMAKNAPNLIKSSILGSVLGGVGVIPGGILGGAAMVTTLQVLYDVRTIKETFQSVLFGEEGVDGKRRGGIIGSIKIRVIDPIADYVKKGLDNFGDYFNDNFLVPLLKMFRPMSDWISGKGIKMLEGVGNVLKKAVNDSFGSVGEVFHDTIGKALGLQVGVGKWGIDRLLQLGTLPGKALTGLTDAWERHNVRAGYSTRSAQERVDLLNGKTSGYNMRLAQLEKEGNQDAIEQLILNTDLYSRGLDSAKGIAEQHRRETRRKITASLSEGGLGKDTEARKRISRMMRSKEAEAGDFTGLLNYINGLDSSLMGDANKKLVQKLLEDETAYITNHNKKVENYNKNRSEFFKSVYGINIPENATNRQAERILSKYGLKDQAYTDFRGLDKATREKFYGDIEKNKNLDKLRAQDPLEGDTNKKVGSIRDFVEKIANGIDTFIKEFEAKKAAKKAKKENNQPGAKTDTTTDTTDNTTDDTPVESITPTDVLDASGNVISNFASNVTSGKTNTTTTATPGTAVNVPLLGFNPTNIPLLPPPVDHKTKSDVESVTMDDVLDSKGNVIAKANNPAMNAANANNGPKDGDKQRDTTGKEYEYRNGKPEINMADGETKRIVDEERKEKEETKKFRNFFLNGGLFAGIGSIFGLGKKQDGEKKESPLMKLIKGIAGGVGGLFGGIGDAVGGYKQGVATLLSGGNPELGSLLSMAAGGSPLGIIGKVAPFLIIPGILTVAYLFNKDKVDGFLKGLDFGDTSSGLGLVLDKARTGLLLIGDTLDEELGPLGDKILEFGKKVKANLPYIKESADAVLETIGTTYTQFNDPEQGLHAIINSKPKLSEDNPFKNFTETICGVTKMAEVSVLGLSAAGKMLVKIAGLPILNGLVKSAASAITGATDDISYLIKGDIMGILANDWCRNSFGMMEKGDDLSNAVSLMVPFALEVATKPLTIPLTAISWAIHKAVEYGAPIISDIIDGGSAALTSFDNAFKYINKGDIVGALNVLSFRKDNNNSENVGQFFANTVLAPAYPAIVTSAAVVKLIKVFDETFNNGYKPVDHDKYLEELNAFMNPDEPIEGYDDVVNKYLEETDKGGLPALGDKLGILLTGWLHKIPVSIARFVRDTAPWAGDALGWFGLDVNADKKTKSGSKNTDENGVYYDKEGNAHHGGGASRKFGDASEVIIVKDRSNSVQSARAAKKNTVILTENTKGSVASSTVKAISNLNNLDYDVESANGSGIHVKQEGNERYGGRTLGEVGCGPAAAATVLRAYGKGADLRSAAAYARNRGYEVGGASGTKAGYFNDVFSANGIKSNYVAGGGLEAAVSSGKPTVLLGQDKSNTSKTNSPFGPKPHYVVASGTDNHGNVFVDDPELNNTALYPKSAIKRGAKFGITTGGESGATIDTSTNNTGSTLPKASNNVEAIWGYYKALGLSDNATAGILGNIKAEAGGNYDPKTVEHLFINHLSGKSGGKWVAPGNIYKDYGVDVSSYNKAYETYTQALDNKKISLDEFQHPYKEYVTKTGDTRYKSTKGHEWLQYGYGLVGFTDPGLKAELYNATVAQGKSISDLGAQLDVLTNQLKACGVWSKISDNNITAQDAARHMLIDYEKPDGAENQVGARGNNAVEFAQKYGGKNFDISGYVSNINSSGSSTTTSTTPPPEFPKYQLSAQQLSGLANIIQHEQPTTAGRYAEASLMANLTDKWSNSDATAAKLVNKATGGWFAHGSDRYAAGRDGKTSIDANALKAAEDVFINGLRTVPRYVDEHDCFSDLKSISTGDNVRDRSAYIPHQTIIKNKMGSTYTFYKFPDNQSDGFGYISNDLREKYGEGHYDVDESGNVTFNNTSATTSTTNNTTGNNTSSKSLGTDIGSIINKFFRGIFKAAIDNSSGKDKSMLQMIFGDTTKEEEMTKTEIQSADTSNTSSTNTNIVSNAANTGTKGDYNCVMNGFPYYNQGVEPWASTKYGLPSKTLGGSGCGPTSMAMIMKSYGIDVTPKDVGDYSYARGHYKGEGTYQSLYPDAASANGLTATYVGPSDRASVENYLKQGIPLINSQSHGHFTDGRHMIAIVGLDDNGNYYVNDPSWEKGRIRSTHAWAPSEIYKKANYFYAISKNGEGSIGNEKYGNKPLTPTATSVDGSKNPGGSSGLPLYNFTGGASDALALTSDKPRTTTATVTSSVSKPLDYNEVYERMLKIMAQIAANTANNAYLPTIVELIKQLSQVVATVNGNNSKTSIAAEDAKRNAQQDLTKIMAKLDQISMSL